MNNVDPDLAARVKHTVGAGSTLVVKPLLSSVPAKGLLNIESIIKSINPFNGSGDRVVRTFTSADREIPGSNTGRGIANFLEQKNVPHI